MPRSSATPNTGAPINPLPSKTPRDGPICRISNANTDMTRKIARPSPHKLPAGGTTQIWKISVTPAQRAQITLAAKRANMPIGQFIHDRAVNGQAQARHDWAIGAQRLAAATTCLERLVPKLTRAATPQDTVTILAALISLERDLNRIARPWLRSTDTDDTPDETHAAIAVPVTETGSC